MVRLIRNRIYFILVAFCGIIVLTLMVSTVRNHSSFYNTLRGYCSRLSPDVYEELKPYQRISFGVDRDPLNSIKVATVGCGNNPSILLKIVVLVKSVVILTKSPVHFYIVTDIAGPEIHQMIQEWPIEVKSRFSYDILPAEYPGIGKSHLEEWREMYRPCSTARLFFPKVFPNLDSLLYLDADTLLLDDIKNLWNEFQNMNEDQIAGIGEEFLHPTQRMGWQYDEGRNHKIPIVGKSGLNAGVIAMNLTRMREFGFCDLLVPIYNQFRDIMYYADQAIINVIFHRNPEKLYTLACRWNFWDNHCISTDFCLSAQESGVGLMHHTGYDEYWDKSLHAVYRAFQNYNFEEDMRLTLLQPLKDELRSLETVSKCGSNTWVFYKGLETLIDIMQN